MERDSGTVFVDQQVDVPMLELAIVEHVVGSGGVLVDTSGGRQVGEAPSGVGAKPSFDLHSPKQLEQRLTLSPKLARLLSGTGVVHSREALSADPLVRLAEHDELAYVHVERSAFSFGYEKGGAMQFAKGGYMHPEVAALRRARRRVARRLQLELACARDVQSSALASISRRSEACVSWRSGDVAVALAASRVARAGSLVSALSSNAHRRARAAVSLVDEASTVVESSTVVDAGVVQAQLGI